MYNKLESIVRATAIDYDKMASCMAYALGKPIYLLGLDSSTFLSHTNVMLAFTGKCMTIREYKKFLTNNNPKFIKIHNDWEGIE